MSMASALRALPVRPQASDLEVPFVDLRHANEAIKAGLLKDISGLIDTGAFTNGPQVGAFERAFAAYSRADHCVGLASGLDALRLALLAVGLGRGEEVVVPAQTFVATYEAVTQAGGVPIVADIRPDDYTIDLDAVRAALSPRARVVLPVHLYGQMADMRALVALADHKDLAVVEDACQAHGAERDGVRPGELSNAAAFSFYPGKNLGAMGDAGAVVTGEAALAARLRVLREHGQTSKYGHEEEGYTARLDTIQAIVLLRKLELLDRWNAERVAAARFYDDVLTGVGDLGLPARKPGSRHAWHLYVVRTGRAAALVEFLRRRGIGTGRHYPTPPHLSLAYSWLGHREGSFPVAEVLAREGVSLPLFPGIDEAQLATVAAGVVEFFRRG